MTAGRFLEALGTVLSTLQKVALAALPAAGVLVLAYILVDELRRDGIQVQPIPFRLSGDARNAVIAGTVPMMFDGIATMLPLIRAGRVRALATTGTERSPLMPELPTVAETLHGYQQIGFNGLLAPTGTPRHVVERLNAAVNRILATDQLREQFGRLGAEPAPMTPEQFHTLLREDIERRREWIRIAGIRPE